MSINNVHNMHGLPPNFSHLMKGGNELDICRGVTVASTPSATQSLLSVGIKALFSSC